ncbi:MAG: cyclic nucleotide-binding domain-containing protein [Myxococcota bacterium]
MGFLRGSWHLPTRRYEAGEAVVTEGEPGDEAFLIRSGRCRVHSRSAGDIRELGPGEVFGELAVLSADGRRTSSVSALTALARSTWSAAPCCARSSG